MSVFEAIILGIVQGIGEFLPISSSGHLLLLQRFFGIEENLLTFNVVVHVGTLVPVLWIYGHRLKGLIQKPFQKLTGLLMVGTLPAVGVALFLDDWVDRAFSGNYLAVGFLITALFLFIIDMKPRDKGEVRALKAMTYVDAGVIGLIQAVAIAPGISRSGSTIFGGVIRGLDKQSAADFAFLLAIPAIAGATVLEVFALLGRERLVTEAVISAPFVAGFFVAMGVGYVSIKLMLRLVVQARLRYFAYYLMVLSGVIVAESYLFERIF